MGRTVQHPREVPGRFEDLVQIMPPRAITDDVHLRNTIEMIDQLMGAAKLTKGQEAYVETLTQLVGFYEAEHHAIDFSGITGVDSLRYLLDENGMSAGDLADLLGEPAHSVDAIFAGKRELTVDHLRTLTRRFHVDASFFL